MREGQARPLPPAALRRLRPRTPPEPPTWHPHQQHRLSAEESEAARNAAQGALRGIHAKAAETRRGSSRERSPVPTNRRQPTPSRPESPERESRRAWSVEPALAQESRPSRTSLITRPVALAPKSSAYPVKRFHEQERGTYPPPERYNICGHCTYIGSSSLCPESGMGHPA